MDGKAFEILYCTWFHAVNSYLLALTGNQADADDITQEAFLKYYHSAGRFRENSSELPLLCTIGKNIYLDRLRKDKRLTPLSEQEEADLDISIEEHLADRSDAMRIHEILHNLPEPYKEVFSLRIFGELSFPCISALFGKSESWAKMTFYRAKGKIIAAMKEEK